jgi:putative phosphonate transport system ATP-binding protein
MMTPVLSIRNVSKLYGAGCPRCLDADTTLRGNQCSYCRTVVACRNVSFDLYDEEVLGIVGESGSGKSTLLKLLYFQEDPTFGSMHIHADGRHREVLPGIGSEFMNDTNLFLLNPFRKRLMRNHLMGMVYQNPHLGLKLDVSAGGNIGERLLMAGCRRIQTIRDRAMYLLGKTEVPVSRIDDVPANFSGGMQQRVQIAKALSTNPLLLFLDEPTTGLDLSVQARVLDLIKSLQKEMRLTTIVVSHDLGIIRHLTTRTMVMKDGVVVESGLTDQIMEDPQHEFTQLLVSSTL